MSNFSGSPMDAGMSAYGSLNLGSLSQMLLAQYQQDRARQLKQQSVYDNGQRQTAIFGNAPPVNSLSFGDPTGRAAQFAREADYMKNYVGPGGSYESTEGGHIQFGQGGGAGGAGGGSAGGSGGGGSDMSGLMAIAQMQQQASEAERNRQQQMVMQARGFGQDQYAQAQQQYNQYGLGR